MKETDLDMELLDYLLNSVKNWVVNDILEDRTRDWKYFFAISDARRIAKEKHQVELKLEDFDSEIMNNLIYEFEKNIKVNH